MKIYFRALPMLARSPKRIALAELLPFSSRPKGACTLVLAER